MISERDVRRLHASCNHQMVLVLGLAELGVQSFLVLTLPSVQCSYFTFALLQSAIGISLPSSVLLHCPLYLSLSIIHPT
ncbi:hypothetical protein BKA82DRAFT_4208684 [Pisolithus tinctorius]|nr:hypothetical protein BKA82DRAFT_4208684 [Pisolithus tinctorius]